MRETVGKNRMRWGWKNRTRKKPWDGPDERKNRGKENRMRWGRLRAGGSRQVREEARSME
jgi:hypothetical protein